MTRIAQSVPDARVGAGRRQISGGVASSWPGQKGQAGSAAAGCRGGLPGFALAAVLAALLLLRTRFYADPRCRTALGWCGLSSVAAVVALATVSAPRYAGPVVVLAVALAGWCRAGRDRHTSSWARASDVAEYILLAAVVPLACWAADVYGMVRSLSVG